VCIGKPNDLFLKLGLVSQLCGRQMVLENKREYRKTRQKPMAGA
jgi:hypothetical protein